MRPPKRHDMNDYERVGRYDDWIPGEIEDVTLKENHEFKFQGQTSLGDAVRFKFQLDGCQFPKYTRWMRYSFSEKSNLFVKYLKFLVENAQPDMEFDLDRLKGLKVKIMYSKNEEYDNLDAIRPIGAKVPRNGVSGITAKQAEADRQAEAYIRHKASGQPDDIAEDEIPFAE